MEAVPDGYVRWPDPEHGPGLRMLDPTDCPAGHRFRFGQRQNVAHCKVHGTHDTWLCACGQWIWRYDGAFIGEKPACVG